jgi:hypothetical protein
LADWRLNQSSAPLEIYPAKRGVLHHHVSYLGSFLLIPNHQRR